MNWPRYKFHKESEPELREFFKAVREQSSNSPPSDVNPLWEKFLPVDTSLQQKFKIEPSVVEIIDITESDHEKDECCIRTPENNVDKDADEDFLSNDYSYLHLTENQSRNKTTEDFINEIRDLLETEELLSDDVIKQFASECSQQQLQDIFTALASDLNSDCILKLWKSITAANCVEENMVTYFLQHILIQKIVIKSDTAVTVLLQETFNAFPEKAIAVLLTVILQNNNVAELKKLRDNLTLLSKEHKSILLREFEENCPKLELHHFGTILCLLTAHSDSTNFNKLVDLMSHVCKDFSSEKAFGKFLLEVIQALGGNIIRHEQQLNYIISTHKSIFKSQIVNVFENALQEQKLLSQSMRM